MFYSEVSCNHFINIQTDTENNKGSNIEICKCRNEGITIFILQLVTKFISVFYYAFDVQFVYCFHLLLIYCYVYSYIFIFEKVTFCPPYKNDLWAQINV